MKALRVDRHRHASLRSAGGPRSHHVASCRALHITAALLFITLGACAGSTYPAGASAVTYQNATVQRCNYKPSKDTVRALLRKNELFKDPEVMSTAICSQVGLK